jgi:dipeptidase E
VKLLLTSGGVTNPSIHAALLQLLGKPVAESHALVVPTAQCGATRGADPHRCGTWWPPGPASGTSPAWDGRRWVSSSSPPCPPWARSDGSPGSRRPTCSWPTAATRRTCATGCVVGFSIFPHLDAFPGHTLADAKRWAAALGGPAYAIDEQTAIKVDDGSVEVISEGQWTKFGS